MGQDIVKHSDKDVHYIYAACYVDGVCTDRARCIVGPSQLLLLVIKNKLNASCIWNIKPLLRHMNKLHLQKLVHMVV